MSKKDKKEKKADWLERYRGLQVVLDVDPGHVLIGTLLDFGRDYLRLTNADLHNYRDANSTKEVYLYEASRFGVNVNRKEVSVPRDKVFAISTLDDADTA